MSKKILIIIISVMLCLLLVGLVGYYLVLQSNTTSPGETSVFQNFFPFGGSNPGATTTPIGEVPPEPVIPPPTNFTKKLRELSVEPVAGAGVLDSKFGTSTQTRSVVRYIEKATGHIFEVELFSPNKNRISNTTIPTVYDAIWGNKNTSLIARYLKEDSRTVDTYSITLKNTSTTTENIVSAIPLPGNINDISVFGNNIFYLQQNDTSSSGYVANFALGNKKLIWNSPIKELLSQYINTKTVTLTTKPAQSIPGFMYSVDTGTGQVKQVLGNIFGLSTNTNGLGTKVLYSEQSNTSQMFVYDVKSKSAVQITPATFPEKCVWGIKNATVIYCAVPRGDLNGNSLTSWYQGLISTSDDIWKYDTKNNTSSFVENLSEDAGTSIDAIKPILSDGDQYLIFMNKIDNTLWSLDLTK